MHRLSLPAIAPTRSRLGRFCSGFLTVPATPATIQLFVLSCSSAFVRSRLHIPKPRVHHPPSPRQSMPPLRLVSFPRFSFFLRRCRETCIPSSGVLLCRHLSMHLVSQHRPRLERLRVIIDTVRAGYS